MPAATRVAAIERDLAERTATQVGDRVMLATASGGGGSRIVGIASGRETRSATPAG